MGLALLGVLALGGCGGRRHTTASDPGCAASNAAIASAATGPAERVSPGMPVAFTSIPCVGPTASVTVNTGRPIDPGADRAGSGAADVRYLTSVKGGDVTNKASLLQHGQTRTDHVRFINIAFQLINRGTTSFTGQVEASVTDAKGKEHPAADAHDATYFGPSGRTPDWADGARVPVRGSVTMFLTFPVPVGVRLRSVSVNVNEGGTGMDPLQGVVVDLRPPA